MNTAQQFFDAIVNHLRAQGCKSLNEDGKPAYRGVPVYQGVHGCRCPIGILIDDKDYSPKMEGFTVIQLMETKLLPKKLIKDWEDHKYFLQRLQYVHDHVSVDMWEQNWDWLAREYGLVFVSLEKKDDHEQA